MRALFIRHGLTRWNEEGRIQGQTDVPLSPAGREQVAAWRLPPDLAAARSYVSPLGRARETARILGLDRPAVDDRLREMAWGAYEGEMLVELRRRHRTAFADIESRGLDLRAPGGESPREVSARLAGFLAEAAVGAGDLVIVAHKGILRASIVLAFGWDMLGEPPVAIRDDRALLHRLDPAGRLRFEHVVPLRDGA
ncbi:MAG TPA: histidine phosphatase family protein [Geminicoccaceae bacterium]|nr:histidine phosphatase family protein [Geminicoccus sp.]HMU52776.1 histidine phosphatase family protein [Geminicoccaceae bacterium]